MSLAEYFQGVSVQLQELLWRDVPNWAALAERDRLEQRLERALAALDRQAALREEMGRRVARHEERADWLSSHVEIYLRVGDQANAYRHALELDRLRPTLEEERIQLRRLQQACETWRSDLEHLEESLTALQYELCR